GLLVGVAIVGAVVGVIEFAGRGLSTAVSTLLVGADADVAAFGLAARRAAIAVGDVTVVALFIRVDDAVAAAVGDAHRLVGSALGASGAHDAGGGARHGARLGGTAGHRERGAQGRESKYA